MAIETKGEKIFCKECKFYRSQAWREGCEWGWFISCESPENRFDTHYSKGSIRKKPHDLNSNNDCGLYAPK